MFRSLVTLATLSTFASCLHIPLVNSRNHLESAEVLDTRDILPRQTAPECTQITITWNLNVTTVYGDEIFILGNIAQLSDWDTQAAVALSASQYTAADPLWTVSVNIPPGTSFGYKFIKWGYDGALTWEAGENHIYDVPTDCTQSPVISEAWQGAAAASSTSTVASSSSSASPATGSSSVTPTSVAAVASSASSTSTTSGALSGTTVAATTATACANSASERGCWTDSYNIDTDFDNHWPTTGNTVSYNFDITNTTLAPDGVSRMVFAINGQYPGPTIYANWGDMISVTVTNNLQNNGTGLHFHGVRQWHSNQQDGVPGTTECPIAPGTSKTYTFQATQYGTSWYHSHFSSQYGNGIVGPIVIYGPATANYDLDLGPLPITDWYYTPIDQLALRTERPGILPPVADTGLINGTMVSSSGGSYATTTLTAGSRHRIRLINTSVDNHFMVSMDGHTLEVITADFVPIVPYNTTWLFLAIGQRFDVIITADQAPGDYWFRAEVQSDCGSNNNNNILAHFAYEGHGQEDPLSTATSYTERCTDETQLVPHWNSFVPPQAGFATPTFLGTAINMTTDPNGNPIAYWQVNGSALGVHWNTPLNEYARTNNVSYPAGSNVITLATETQWTYYVIASVAGSPYTVNVPHPLHLHGHDFFILGTGYGSWDASLAEGLNYSNPPRRDTAMLPSGGWIVLAWQNDNPGAWLFHCHIAWHAGEGLGVQFLEAPTQMMTVDPLGTAYDDVCSSWASFYPAEAPYMMFDSGV